LGATRSAAGTTTVEVDVLVVGGGPAGAAAALTLRNRTAWRVGLVDRGAAAGPRVGETVGAAVHAQLCYLGLDHELSADSHTRAWATAAAWGSGEVFWRESIFTGYGAGWHLDRARFDLRLLDAADAAGADVLRSASVTRCTRAGEGWAVEIHDVAGRASRVTARFVIDTTGRAATLAHQLGPPADSHDRLTAVAGFMDADADAGNAGYTLVEAADDGWWYSSSLPGNALVVAWMSDAALVRDGQMTKSSAWRARLARATHTAARVAGRAMAGPLVTRPAATKSRRAVSGPHWIAAGDAAASFDPLAGIGIGFALHSGIHAARVANEELQGVSTLRAAYEAAVEATVREFRERSRALYAQERRWSDRLFWRRRASSDATRRTSPRVAGARQSADLS
jgi:flavin-dependent dehydrogenase